MNIKLLPWEYRELTDELESNSTWVFTGTSWIHMNQDGDATCGFRVTHGTGPLRFSLLTVFAVNYTQEQAVEFISSHIRWWTGYYNRIRTAQLLTEHLGVEPAKAEGMAIIISMDQNGSLSRPEELPTQIPFHGPVEPPPDVKDRERLFSIKGGGWVKVCYHGEQFSVRLSIPSMTGGFLHPFRGYIHNDHTRKDVAAEAIFGWRNHDRRHPSQAQGFDPGEDQQTGLPLEAEEGLRRGGEGGTGVTDVGGQERGNGDSGVGSEPLRHVPSDSVGHDPDPVGTPDPEPGPDLVL